MTLRGSAECKRGAELGYRVNQRPAAKSGANGVCFIRAIKTFPDDLVNDSTLASSVHAAVASVIVLVSFSSR